MKMTARRIEGERCLKFWLALVSLIPAVVIIAVGFPFFVAFVMPLLATDGQYFVPSSLGVEYRGFLFRSFAILVGFMLLGGLMVATLIAAVVRAFRGLDVASVGAASLLGVFVGSLVGWPFLVWAIDGFSESVTVFLLIGLAAISFVAFCGSLLILARVDRNRRGLWSAKR